MNFVQSAFDLCALGLKVLPLIPGRKLPAIKDWQTKATDDEWTVAEWADKWPDANIGAVTGGESGVLVIDVDVKDGAPGLETINDLAARGKRLPACPVSVTPSGGRHFWFRSVPGLRNCAGRSKSGRGIGAGVDVRADGGFIICPPSKLAQTDDHGAGSYRWLIPPGGDFPDLPDWAVQMIKEKPLPVQPFVLREATGNAEERLERIAAFVAQAPKGQRNQSLYWAVRESLRAGINAKDATERLTQAASAIGLHGLEIKQTIASGLNAERGAL